MQFLRQAEFLKVDDTLGLIIGYAMVCKVDGEDYYDLGELQPDGSRIRDHITEAAMLKSSADFMLNSRAGCTMHRRDGDGAVVKTGDVIYCFPMTTEIAKALDIVVKRTGLLVGIKPSDPGDLAKARRGEYRGFSIGGTRVPSAEEIVDA